MHSNISPFSHICSKYDSNPNDRGLVKSVFWLDFLNYASFRNLAFYDSAIWDLANGKSWVLEFSRHLKNTFEQLRSYNCFASLQQLSAPTKHLAPLRLCCYVVIWNEKVFNNSWHGVATMVKRQEQQEYSFAEEQKKRKETETAVFRQIDAGFIPCPSDCSVHRDDPQSGLLQTPLAQVKIDG